MILYLHGRGVDPRLPPGDAVLAHDWPLGMRAPPLTEAWLALPFPEQVACVDEWLDGCEAAIGFSWGAWLLLCATLERLERGLEMTPLLLLSCVLGEGNYTGSQRWKAPRAKEILGALGVEGTAATMFPLDRIRFIQGLHDTVGDPDAAQRFCDAGHVAHGVHGGHGLRGKQATQVIARELNRLGYQVEGE